MGNSMTWKLQHWIIGGYTIPAVSLIISGSIA